MKKYSNFNFQFSVLNIFLGPPQTTADKNLGKPRALIYRLRRLKRLSSLGAPHSDAGKKYSVSSTQYSKRNTGEPPVIQSRDLRNPLQIFIFLTILIFTTSSQAQKLEFSGILGNSGEQGKTLANFSMQRNQKLDDGLGLIYDKFGTLWSSAGAGQINRYALDGRLLAKFHYQSNSNTHMDRMVLCDDKIIIFANKNLFSLDINAAPDSSAKKLLLKVKRIGMSNMEGLFPALNENKEILLVKSDGSVFKKYTIDMEPWDLFLTDENTINLKIKEGFRTVKNGKLLEEANPLKFPGSNMQKIGKNWYAHAWHGTIKKLDENMGPDPGIVLGGSSGSFIGHLAGNYEVNQGKAMAKINKNLYAIGGAGNIIHLMEWKTKEGRFELLRRIGPLSQVRGSLAMDEDGRILIPNGNWLWSDNPDTPLRNSTGREGNGQVTFIDGNTVIGSSYIYGSIPAISYGKLSGELKSVHDRSNKYGFMKETTAFTVLKKGGKHVAYFTNAKGNTARLQLNYLGQPEKKLGAFKLSLKTPVKNWTTFAKINDNKLLAGADGFVIELDTSNSTTWKETKRWKNFASDSFGSQIHINTDKNNLWVSDTDRHRILCFDLQGKLIAKYGKKDAAGDGFNHLKSPTAIAGNSKRVVLYDEGNQRLVKLELK